MLRTGKQFSDVGKREIFCHLSTIFSTDNSVEYWDEKLLGCSPGSDIKPLVSHFSIVEAKAWRGKGEGDGRQFIL